MSSTSDPPPPAATLSRRDISKTVSATKNLRAISLSLVQKVRSRAGVSSTEIANQLAREAVRDVAGAVSLASADDLLAIEKNIRRRLYDSLKVLVSIGAIARTRKDKALTWRGVAHLVPAPFLPPRASPSPPSPPSAATAAPSRARAAAAAATPPRAANLAAALARLRPRLARKLAERAQLQAQMRALHALCRRNARALVPVAARIPMPFVLIRTPPDTEITLDATPDARRIAFSFKGYYELVNDSSILDRIFLVDDRPAAAAAAAASAAAAAVAPVAAVGPVGAGSAKLRGCGGGEFSSPTRRRVASASPSPFAKFTSGSKPPPSPGTPLRRGRRRTPRRAEGIVTPPRASVPIMESAAPGEVPELLDRVGTPDSAALFYSPLRAALSGPPRKRRMVYAALDGVEFEQEGEAEEGRVRKVGRRMYGPGHKDRPEGREGGVGVLGGGEDEEFKQLDVESEDGDDSLIEFARDVEGDATLGEL